MSVKGVVEDCLVRALREEITAGPLLDAWTLAIGEREVFIVTYGCHAPDAPVHSDEHHEAGLFTPAEVAGLPMPDGHKRPRSRPGAAGERQRQLGREGVSGRPGGRRPA
jgi:hypothetical protein